MASNACRGWDNSNCEGTKHCPPRCPRYIDKTGTPVLIRPYEDDSLESLLAMYDAVETSTMALPPSDPDARETWLRQLTADGWNLVAICDDRIVGHVAVAPASASEPEFVIFVHPDYQNRGIGTELLEHVVAHAADRNHEELHLNVARERKQAITVYEKVGFDVTSTNVMDLEMALPLEEPLVTLVQRPPADRD
ncbi:GNAT family N-acetyltransferase [Natronolimnohabitans innermongolicus]|uniref:N-acetyltransferase GCN5 n=1 Tax=Natronolimnohabitans innermongolicus JCM 12255 TaxID=1227499 RepID=L9WNW8_9EURY|nr:GNAT family N-acetyltransferase [Natronolimnohabitans innermongolicus]ELY50916.1 N-acetyltransferase GCN5 [Natronolimnohabitans innermongolicus JCM 12255]